MSDLSSHIMQSLTAELRASGFTSRPGRIFERETRQPSKFGWLGLSTGRERGRVVLYPQVGVRDNAVTHVLGELLGRPTSPYAATAAVNIGLTFGAEPLSWAFEREKAVAPSIREIVNLILRDGIPFMEQLATDRIALERVIREHSMQQDVVLPALWLAHGDCGAAARHVSKTRATLPPEGEWRDFYVAFAQRVADRASACPESRHGTQ